MSPFNFSLPGAAPASPGLTSYTIEVDGKRLEDIYQVLAVRVQRELNRIPTAHLVLRDGDVATGTFAVSEAGPFVPGSQVRISAGYDGQEEAVFEGLVIKHAIEGRSSGTTRLNVTCKDAFVKTTLAVRRQYFLERRDSEVAEELVRKYKGLKIDAETTPVLHPELLQYDATDWDFLLMRAEANGQVALVEDGRLTLAKPDTGQAPVVTLRYGEDLFSFDAEVDARDQVSRVQARAWDHAAGTPASTAADEPRNLPNQGNWTASELADALDTELDVQYGGHLATEELQAWADGLLLRRRLAKIRGRVQFAGSALVKPGTTISLKGLGDRFNGTAYVTGVSHRIEEGRWLTDAQFGLDPRGFGQATPVVSAPAAGGLVPGLRGLHIGLVTALAGDPDGEERIAVRLPLVDAASKGARARIVNVDAGKGRGFYFRPEVGDEVVVGFLHDDPRQAVVLGSLYSSRNQLPAPFVTADANHLKGYVSRSQLQVLFDDEKKVLTLQTPGGNLLKLDDEAKGITLQDQHGNKIVLGEDGIVIEDKNGNKLVLGDSGSTLESPKAITLQATTDAKLSGQNVELAAQAQFKATGSAGLEVSSSGQAVLKGAMVLIN